MIYYNDHKRKKIYNRRLNLKCYFFSRRRGHRRFDCDWSSDVCSSDLFILFQPSYGGSKSYLSQPLMTGDAKTVQTIEPFIIGRLPKWAKSAKEQPKFRPSPEVSTEMCEKKWAAGLATALRPEAAPRAITSLARRRVETDMDLAEELRKAKSAGRYGATFGIAVHRALQMLVSFTSPPIH